MIRVDALTGTYRDLNAVNDGWSRQKPLSWQNNQKSGVIAFGHESLIPAAIRSIKSQTFEV